MNPSPPASFHASNRQQDIRTRCFHQQGTFVEFAEEEIGRSISERFEKVVQLYPNRIAVTSNGRGSTYAELNAQANRVARHILAKQETPGAPIALLLEPSAFAIAAVIGVLKAGDIYVPLDPTYPRARILAILDDSGASIIVTDAKNAELATALAAKTRSFLVAEEMAASSAEDPRVISSPAAPMAIFYTSGSTGQPKGVVQNHRSVLHRVMVDTNNFHICREDRLSLISSPSFSVSLRNLFGGLLNGATVCPFEASGDGLRQLKDWLVQESVTIYFSVPTVFRQLVENIRDQTEFTCLRLIYLAGESVTKEDVALYKQYFPQAILVNSLASNEAGIIRQYFMDRNTVITESRVPGGYAVEGKEIVVVNEQGAPVGKGDAGEICVRSRYLSPGYWKNPDMTKAVFAPDPGDSDVQLYQTGDVGYFGDDDCLIHLGRKGLRVKIRGSRVELEEVEAALRQHPAIRDVVVDTLKDDVEAERLIAYVVSVQGRTPTVSELRDDLGRNLPPYMVPSSFVFLSSLPLTPNGKIDRRALPKPDSSRPDLKAQYVAPRTADEEQLVEIWSKVLSIDQVGVRDNFFDLGGNSLCAAILVGQINRALGANLTISAFYQAPTIEQLVKVLRQELATFSWSSLFPLQLHGVKNPFFWIHGQVSDGVLPAYLGPDQPVYGMTHQSADGKPAPYQTVEEIAAHYLAEIRTVRPRGPYLLGGYCFGGVVAFEMAQQLLKQNESASLVVLLDPPMVNNSITGSGNSQSVGVQVRGALNRQLRVVQASVSLTDKIKGVVGQFVASVKKQAVRIGGKVIIKSSLTFGCLIPLKLRGQYILDVYNRALTQYIPKAYPGRVVVFKAAADDRDTQHWTRLAPEALELHVVPGNHDDILKEPYVPGWAKKVKLYLDQTLAVIPEDSVRPS
jgi:amino acid adenylation domain-containing protein